VYVERVKTLSTHHHHSGGGGYFRYDTTLSFHIIINMLCSSEEGNWEDGSDHHHWSLDVSTEWSGRSNVSASTLRDLSWSASTDVGSSVGTPDSDASLGAIEAELSDGLGLVGGGGGSEEVAQGGAAWADSAVSVVAASLSGGGGILEGLDVDLVDAVPLVDGTGDGEVGGAELNGGADGGGSWDGSPGGGGRGELSQGSAAEVSGAWVSGAGGGGSARGGEGGGSDSGGVAGSSGGALEVSWEELSWGNEAEGGEDSELVHLLLFICLKVFIWNQL